jgi:hypothetical protein
MFRNIEYTYPEESHARRPESREDFLRQPDVGKERAVLATTFKTFFQVLGNEIRAC